MKKLVISAVAVALLVIGMFFVSAQVDAEEETDVPQVKACGADTCGGQCGGSCGIPKCGCGG